VEVSQNEMVHTDRVNTGDDRLDDGTSCLLGSTTDFFFKVLILLIGMEHGILEGT
jgi:hypothetical protein